MKSWLPRFSPILKPYHLVMRIRRDAYRSGWLSGTFFQKPVLSVGNIAWGGTGKTPLVVNLAEKLAKRQLRPVIVSRGYGRLDRINGPLHVTREHVAGLDAERIGDEAIEYGMDSYRWSSESDSTGVVISSDREGGVRYAFYELGADAVVLDDGFQHRAIQRNLDLVVLDATRPWAGGFLRESPRTVRDAELVALSRVDVVSTADLKSIEKQIRKYGYEGPILHGCHEPEAILEIGADSFGEPSPKRVRGKNALLVTAVANPDGVKRTMESQGVTIQDIMRWPDHHHYYMVDVMRIVAFAKECGVDTVITTRKDAVKLAPFIRQDNRGLAWLALQVGWRWIQGEDVIDGYLEKLLPIQ